MFTIQTTARKLGCHPDCNPKLSDWLAGIACLGLIFILPMLGYIATIIVKG